MIRSGTSPETASSFPIGFFPTRKTDFQRQNKDLLVGYKNSQGKLPITFRAIFCVSPQ